MLDILFIAIAAVITAAGIVFTGVLSLSIFDDFTEPSLFEKVTAYIFIFLGAAILIILIGVFLLICSPFYFIYLLLSNLISLFHHPKRKRKGKPKD